LGRDDEGEPARSARGEAKRDQMARAAVTRSTTFLRRVHMGGLEGFHCTGDSLGAFRMLGLYPGLSASNSAFLLRKDRKR
jgi:hypothetical protein